MLAPDAFSVGFLDRFGVTFTSRVIRAFSPLYACPDISVPVCGYRGNNSVDGWTDYPKAITYSGDYKYFH